MSDYGSFNPSNFRYLTSEILDAGAGAAILGGVTLRMAAAASLLFGDVVQVTGTAGRVDKATTNLWKTCGVVVGGVDTDNLVLTDSAGVGVTLCATDAGDEVLVQRAGVCYMALDTVDIAIGDSVIPSAITAGRASKGAPALIAPSTGSTTMTGGSTNSAAIEGNGPAVPIIGLSQTTETVAGNPIIVLLKGLY